jgi:hypothetical protein
MVASGNGPTTSEAPVMQQNAGRTEADALSALLVRFDSLPVLDGR